MDIIWIHRDLQDYILSDVTIKEIEEPLTWDTLDVEI